MKNMSILISVIIPVYNCENWIRETIQSVIAQSYRNWEIILVDDCSTDRSFEICQEYSTDDGRIKAFQLQYNQGPAKARNYALNKSNGRYIAFLDADDLWFPQKLERQLELMQCKHIAITCTAYYTIDEDGSIKNEIHLPNEITYKKCLMHPITCSHTLMADTEMIDKQYLEMPDLRIAQDFVAWLSILKRGYKIFAIQECLAKYRKHGNDSLSSNILKAAKAAWNVYFRVEKLPVPYALLCYCSYAINAVHKRIYIPHRFNESQVLQDRSSNS